MSELILECCGKPESQCRCDEPTPPMDKLRREEAMPEYEDYLPIYGDDEKTHSLVKMAFQMGVDATASIKDAECHKRITAVEKILSKNSLEIQTKLMDTVLKKDAEWKEKLQDEHYKRQAESDRADWAESEIKKLKEDHQISLQMLGGDLTDKCQTRAERIFKEIESKSHPTNTNMFGISLNKGDWEALKKQERIK